jgi:lysophospholipase L1-like esterase
MSSATPRRADTLRLMVAAGLLALTGVGIARYVEAMGAGPSHTPVVVAFGDSLTESSAEARPPWPEVLGRRLTAAPRTATVSVVNAGISGNRLLRDGAGPSGLARFDRDALKRPGVRWVVVLEGINDLGFSGSFEPGEPPVTATELVAGYRQLITRARAAGVKLYLGTLLPFEGATGGYFTPGKEEVRAAVNAWMRSSGEHDGVVDFDAATRDPARPTRLRPVYDSGDHLHLSGAGQRAMGEAVDLGLFQLTGAQP